ncbi:hypothetical protein JCM16408A_14770 [Methylobacterium phyllosphaerae]
MNPGSIRPHRARSSNKAVTRPRCARTAVPIADTVSIPPLPVRGPGADRDGAILPLSCRRRGDPATRQPTASPARPPVRAASGEGAPTGAAVRARSDTASD